MCSTCQLAQALLTRCDTSFESYYSKHAQHSSLLKQSKSDTDMLDHIAVCCTALYRLHCIALHYIIRQRSAYAKTARYSICCSVLHEQELNEKDERTRFLQIWMTPDRRGHKPQYGSSKYSKADRHNKLLQILGGTQPMPAWETATSGAGITLHQVYKPQLSSAIGAYSWALSALSPRVAVNA